MTTNRLVPTLCAYLSDLHFAATLLCRVFPSPHSLELWGTQKGTVEQVAEELRPRWVLDQIDDGSPKVL